MNVSSEHRLRNDLAETRHLGPWVEAFAQQAHLPPRIQSALDLSLVEWVTNIISYAYEDAQEHWITVRFRSRDGEVQVEIEDDGREFNPLTHPPADTTEPLETRAVGGLGIHMIRQLMNAAEYQRINGRNILTLTKT